jgi:thiamine pyrophosphokinase
VPPTREPDLGNASGGTVQHETVIVVAGTGPPSVGARSLPREATVIAADGGLERAQALGLEVDLAVGDFDSASSEAIAQAEAAGTRLERHPVEKDATDLELALDAAALLGPRRVLVLASADGRLDHLLAGLLALAAEPYSAFEIDALIGDASAHVIRGERRLTGEPGELLTLVPVHGPAEGVVTEGLAYPLRGETLAPGSSRGVSNVFAAPEARLSLTRGVLLAIRPGEANGDGDTLC